MFSDPQSVTVNAVAQTLPRTDVLSGESKYSKDDGNLVLVVSHSYGKRKRFVVRLNAIKIAPDPLASANNVQYTTAATLTIDAPLVGYTNAELRDYALALSGWCTSANLLKVLGGET